MAHRIPIPRGRIVLAGLLTGVLVALGCGKPKVSPAPENVSPPAHLAEGQPAGAPTATAVPPGVRPPAQLTQQPAAQPATVPASKPRQPVVVVRRKAEAGPYNLSIHFELLCRELLCQAFLIAARDGLGLGTRDETLGESAPDGWSDAVVELDCHLPNIVPQCALRIGLAGNAAPVVSVPLPSQGSNLDYRALLEKAEQLSRTELVAALKQLGYNGKPNANKASAAVPAATEKHLGAMCCLDQFAALRMLHAALREQGESPELLGGLVRGYANLGFLTPFHWCADHKAFAARALLYAQRLVAAAPESPWGLWHRAYALALVGMHRDALADLEAAGRLRQTSATSRPEWVDWIDAFCRFDSARLAAVGDAKPLAQVLWFFTVAEPVTVHRTIQAGDKVLAKNPFCFRVHDLVSATGGVGVQHKTTVASLQALSKSLPTVLPAVPGLPAAVADGLKQLDEPATVTALREAGSPARDSGTPSWGVLAKLIEETRFCQAQRRLSFMKTRWGVPVDEFLPLALALAGRHPYRAFLESYGLDSGRQVQAYRKLLADLSVADLEFTADPMIRAVRPADAAKADRWVHAAFCHRDAIDEDFRRTLITLAGPRAAPEARRWLEVCPHSPAAQAALIENDWPTAREHAAEWEKAGQALVLATLAGYYHKQGQSADAVRCLEAYVRQSPDYHAYRRLAENYKKLGDLAKWQATLEASLQQEDHGLDHAQAQVELARHFMKQGEWKKAQPYAEAAAQTWAGWAMLCAADCADGLKEWDRAAQWMERVAERYPEERFGYFFWCLRTGHGDRAKARALAEQFIAESSPHPTPDDLTLAGLFYLGIDQPSQAVRALSQESQGRPPDMTSFLLALAADDLKDARLRDETLERLVATKTPKSELARLVAASLGGSQRVERAAWDAALGRLSAPGAAMGGYYVGRVLEKQGRREEAAVYYRRCLASHDAPLHWRGLASVALRERGVGKADEGH